MEMCIIQRIQSAQAQVNTNKPIVFDFFRDQTTTVATQFINFMPELSNNVELLDALLILIICLFTSYIIYRSYRIRHFGHNFTLYAEIGNSETYVKVKLMTLRHTPHLYDFVADQFVKAITITGTLHPRMNFNWKELSIIHKCTQIVTHLQSVHTISHYESYKLSAIIADSHYILLFTKTPDKIFNLVQLNGTTWQTIHPITIARRNDDMIPLSHLPNLSSYANQNAPSYTKQLCTLFNQNGSTHKYRWLQQKRNRRALRKYFLCVIHHYSLYFVVIINVLFISIDCIKYRGMIISYNCVFTKYCSNMNNRTLRISTCMFRVYVLSMLETSIRISINILLFNFMSL